LRPFFFAQSGEIQSGVRKGPTLRKVREGWGTRKFNYHGKGNGGLLALDGD
jgi:hypothetical protein